MLGQAIPARIERRMNSQDKWIRRFRIGAFIVIIILMALAMGRIDSAGINAPLLTITGSATIIIALFSIDRSAFTAQNIGTVFGTVVVMAGGGYWLFDALQKNPIDDAQLLWAQAILTSLILLLLTHLIVSVIGYFAGRISEQDEE